MTYNSESIFAADGHCFNCSLFDPKTVSSYRFEVGEDNRLYVIYVSGNTAYIAVSFDFGQTFSEPRRILNIKGVVSDIRFLERNDQFVVAAKETVIENGYKKDYKRAATGTVNPNDHSLLTRECFAEEIDGELINISLSFSDIIVEDKKKEQSVDHMFIMRNGLIYHLCRGHG